MLIHNKDLGCNLTDSGAGKVGQFPGVRNSKNHTPQGLTLFFFGPRCIIDVLTLLCMDRVIKNTAENYRHGLQ